MKAPLRVGLATGLLALFAWQPTHAQKTAAPPDQIPAGIEVQARGPVHEAFAQPVDLKPEPSPPVPKKPPELVNELPPDEKPEGENIQWIGGYWAWDAERNDYTWISGVYRQVPPGRRFVAGYWTHTPEGWRWVAGFWANGNQGEIPYTPEPPASLENGPSLPAPENSQYVTGYWQFRDNRFVWRPGYFAAVRPGRIWIQPHYQWTPSGYVFVDGYSDFEWEERGVLFAPVIFTRPLWLEAGFCFRPWFAVRPAFALDCLFYRPGSCSFFFGDFYGRQYVNLGFHPWFSGPARFDPLFAHARWQHRNDPGWAAGLRRDHDDRVAGRLALPPRTLVQQTTIVNNKNVDVKLSNRAQGLAPLNQVNTFNNHIKLAKVTNNQVEMVKSQVKQNRNLTLARMEHETNVNKNNVGNKLGANAPTFKLPSQTGSNGETRIYGKPPGDPKVTVNPKIIGDPKIIGNPKTIADPKIIGNPKTIGGDPKIIGNPKTITSPKIIPNTPLPGSKPEPKKISDLGNGGQPKVLDKPAPRITTSNNVPRIVDNPAPAARTITSPSGPKGVTTPVPPAKVISPAPAQPRLNNFTPSPPQRLLNSPSPTVRNFSSPPAARFNTINPGRPSQNISPGGPLAGNFGGGRRR